MVNYNNFMAQYGIGPLITAEQSNKLFEAKMALDEATLLADQKHQHRISELREKSALEIEVLKRKQQLSIERDLLSYGILMDSEGYICKEILDAHSNCIGMKRIISIPGIGITHFHCPYGNGLADAYYVFWPTCDDENPLVFRPETLTADRLASELSKYGISLIASREYRANLQSQLLAFLMDRAHHEQIPRCLGWNIINDQILWVYGSKITMEVLEKYAK